MASSTSPSKALRSMTRLQRALREKSHDPEQIQAPEPQQKASSSNTTVPQLPDSELVNAFKTDLVSIRSLVTCTICVQLLYEPWTLGCGHTYCYSCLSSWFVTHKRNKTCPDCRQAVKNRPAPSFLIKQLIETFINREELMPADESSSQHRIRQKEENEIVEKDKDDPSGLFKGCFGGKQRQRAKVDREDGISRCPECFWEYEGGTHCTRCGLMLGDSDLDSLEDFSEGDDPELYDLELEDAYPGMGSDAGSSDRDIVMEQLGFVPPGFHQRRAFARNIARQEERIMRGDFSSDDMDQSDEDEEETESMRDFIAHDESGFPMSYIDENTYQESNSSADHNEDDDDDENADEDRDEDEDEDEDESAEEEIRRIGPSRRGARGTRQPTFLTAPRRNVIVLDSSDPDSDDDLSGHHGNVHQRYMDAVGEDHEAALMNNGWSPLDHGNDSDEAVEHGPSENESDTETLGRDQDEEVDEDDDLSESTPRRGGFHNALNLRGGQHQNFFDLRRAAARPRLISSSDEQEDEDDEDEDEDDDEDEHQASNTRDNDGDVEMSVSPVASNIPEDESESEEEISQPQTRRTRSRSIRPAVQINDLTGDSSDESVRPALRRRRLVTLQPNRSQRDYSPQISQLFRQYQSEVRDAVAQSAPVYHRMDIPARRAMPSLRDRTSQYRVLPPRRQENGVVRDVTNTLDRQLYFP